ncbi:MAG: hypothetical protein ACRERX_13925, partial [Pseudomonas sp.]
MARSVTRELPITQVATGILTGKPGSRLKVSVFQEVHGVTVTPHVSYTRMPAKQQFRAVARDANGVMIPGQTFEWRSSDLTIAT